MILHEKHASNSYDRILITSPDIDVFVLCVSLQNYIDKRIYFLTGVKNSRRNTVIKAFGENFVTLMNVCNATDEFFLASIIDSAVLREVTLSVPFLAGVKKSRYLICWLSQ